MAEAIKSLGQADLTATTLTDLYTVPASTSTIADVTFCNRSGSAVVIRLAHAPAGAADANAHYKLWDFSLPANESWTTPAPLKLATTDKLRAKAGTANVVTCTVDGVEIS